MAPPPPATTTIEFTLALVQQAWRFYWQVGLPTFAYSPSLVVQQAKFGLLDPIAMQVPHTGSWILQDPQNHADAIDNVNYKPTIPIPLPGTWTVRTQLTQRESLPGAVSVDVAVQCR